MARSNVRLLPLLVLVAACAFAPAQQSGGDRLGKSRDEILAMGSEKWFDFYTSKRGDTTVGMFEAYHVFAQALHERNELKLKRIGPKDRERLERWYKAVQAFGQETFSIQSSGGGTIWVPVGAAQEVDIEELLDKLCFLQLSGKNETTVDVEHLASQIEGYSQIINDQLQKAPANPELGTPRRTLMLANERAKSGFAKLKPELLKKGGAQAVEVLTVLGQLSDPKVLFQEEGK